MAAIPEPLAAGMVSDSAATASADHAAKLDRIWIIGLGALVAIQLWAGMIGTSFWLDETGTWWIIKDGPAEAIHRALSWSGQSPLF
jgi:hypothetical protein